jgi:hypothetical protein
MHLKEFTPQMAKDILEYYKWARGFFNMPLYECIPKTLERYVEAMKNGTFRDNREHAPQFNQRGVLLHGHTKLQAIIESNTTQKLYVQDFSEALTELDGIQPEVKPATRTENVTSVTVEMDGIKADNFKVTTTTTSVTETKHVNVPQAYREIRDKTVNRVTPQLWSQALELAFTGDELSAPETRESKGLFRTLFEVLEPQVACMDFIKCRAAVVAAAITAALPSKTHTGVTPHKLCRFMEVLRTGEYAPEESAYADAVVALREKLILEAKGTAQRTKEGKREALTSEDQVVRFQNAIKKFCLGEPCKRITIPEFFVYPTLTYVSLREYEIRLRNIIFDYKNALTRTTLLKEVV